MAERVERTLTRKCLAEAAKAAPDPYTADGMLYEVVVHPGDEQGSPEVFRLSDSAVAPELGELLSELMGEIVHRRVRESAAGEEE